MQDYKDYFKGKKITIMGLGLLGRGLGVASFLYECGAELVITDLKSKEDLASSIKQLESLKKKNIHGTKKIKFVLGKHRLEDFKNKDLIIKSAGVPMDSIFIEEAKKNKIPVEMDVSLFAKLAKGVMIIGVTGTRGKSMTTNLIYQILKQNEKHLGKNIYLGGNVRGIATLPLLKKINLNSANILVCELDSWQLQGFGDNKISPHISVFTSFLPDHMNYYKNNMQKYFTDKANIFKYQKKGDFLIIRKDVKKLIPQNISSKVIEVKAKDVQQYSFVVPGKHQRENLACAVKVAELLGVPNKKIKEVVKKFKGLEGRLQYLKTLKGIKIYNDNNATTPEATIVGIEALSNLFGNTQQGEIKDRNKIILICGGSDKGLDLRSLEKMINNHCKKAILLKGTGTSKLKNIKNELRAETLKEAVNLAMNCAKKGDILLFSPGFASFLMFKNEYDRGDQFLKIIEKWSKKSK